MPRCKILICGATGFIGRNLTEALCRREDFEIHAVRFTRPAYACPGVTWHTVVCQSNRYGPHDKFDLQRRHVFGATVTKAMIAQDGHMVVWGKGEEARDLLYVSDLVDFVTRAIDRQREPYALYNCGAGEAITVKDLVRMIVVESGRALAIEHDLTKPSIDTSVRLDCRKAERELGWRAQTPLAEGIRNTIAWWKANVPASKSQA